MNELVQEVFVRKQKTGVAFVAIAKALGQAWHYGLIYMLSLLKAPPPIAVYSLAVRVNNSISSSRIIEAGIPQGNLISTWKFHLYINDIPHISDIL